MSNPVGVRTRIRELEAKAPAEIKGRYDAATVAVQDVLPALILNRALPTMPEASQARAEALEEVRMLLVDKSGAALTAAMIRMAGGSERRHAAVVASSWGHARLGGDATQHEAVRMRRCRAACCMGHHRRRRTPRPTESCRPLPSRRSSPPGRGHLVVCRDTLADGRRPKASGCRSAR